MQKCNKRVKRGRITDFQNWNVNILNNCHAHRVIKQLSTILNKAKHLKDESSAF
jgi:hypothetical protein